MRRLRRFRRAHHGLAYLAAAILVLMALVGAAASQILPLAERHPERIAGWLSDRVGHEVAFDRVETRWSRRGPLLKLDNLRIGQGNDAVAIGDAEMLVSQYAGLLPGRSFTELRVRGLDLTLERDPSGRWQVRGLPGQRRAGSDPLASLQRLGELQVIGARLRVLAPALGIDLRVPQVHLRLRVDGERVRAGVRAWMRDNGPPLQAVLDFDRRRGNGRAWLSAERADLTQWPPALRIAGIRGTAGAGRAQAWARLREHRVVGATADLALQHVVLEGRAAQANAVAPRARLERVRGRLRWSKAEGGWRVEAPWLAFGDGASAPRVQGLLLAGGQRYGLVARRIDLGPVLAVAALSDRLAPGLGAWLHASRASATLQSVQVVGRRGGTLQVQGKVAALAFAPVDNAPGLRGLAGSLSGDADAVDFRFDPSSAISVDWPRGFGAPHRIVLAGSLAGWREGAGWRTGTSSLTVTGSDYNARLRGGLWFQGDGSRPWIDLAADVGAAPIAVANRFWLRYGMPSAAIRWLESALVAGTLRDGRAVLSGDLDDWPFRSQGGRPAKGLFHATGRIEGGTVKFLRDWPAAQQMDAEVDFVADGFRVRGSKASIAGVRIGKFDAGIEHFGAGLLTVNAEAAGDAAQLLGLLRQSPLQKTYGQTLANIDASGPARVSFALKQSLLGGAARGDMHGTVALQGARLAEKRWDLAFSEVSGNARYGYGGFETDQLSVLHRQRPGKLSLRAGDYARDKRQAFEAELHAEFAAQDLLQRAPDLAWLKPRVAGSSPWTIAVAIPKSGSAQAPPSRLQLRSNLVGTTLSLPAPLDKPASASLPSTVEIELPLGQGEVALSLGKLMALRARTGNGQTGVRVVLGNGSVGAAPPASGLVVGGRSERLDAIEWAALTRAGAGSAPAQPGGLSLRAADVTVAKWQMIGASFPETRLRAVPSAAGLSVRLDGPALAGSLLLPQAQNAAVSGRLERLYWRAARTQTLPGRAAAAPDDIDPSKVPPLNLVVDELRFGEAKLGAASLRTQPTAGGMRIAQLQTRAPKQSLDASGDWTRAATGQRTALDVRLRSNDVGALLDGFGFGKQIAKGRGAVDLQLHWPGSPAGFSLSGLQGTMALDVRDGQLVEIEPGAGRVLGLLSIAQLPRRLAFDFRDFFDKGFAFDKIAGEVRFGGGSARSDNLGIDGPAAEIRIRGAANLHAQTYDQTIEVYPRAGNLLTVAGAIAGGPVGAAIGAAANAVLKKPLGQLTAKTYRITGPWKDPKVETVSRGAAAAAAKPEDARQ